MTHSGAVRRVICLVATTLTLGSAVCLAVAQTAVPKRVAESGKLVFCSDISFPPLEYFDPKTMQPAGFDIDLGNAIAKVMDVKAEFKNIAFSGLIPALQAGQCDAILSGLFDKPARREVVDFVDYANIGNSIIVKSDSSLIANSLEDLSGKKVAVESGSGLEEEARAASQRLVAQGKPAINVVSFPKASDAFQQLAVGLVDAYYGSTVQEAYYNKQNQNQVKLAGAQTSVFPVGIATTKKDVDLHDSFAAALRAIRANGTYNQIVSRWNFQSMVPQN